MKRPVRWSRSANKEYLNYLRYLTKRSPQAAALVQERVTEATKSIEHFQTGRIGRVTHTFERFVEKTSLILAYHNESDGTVRILRVIHTSRDFKPGTFPPES